MKNTILWTVRNIFSQNIFSIHTLLAGEKDDGKKDERKT